MGAGPYLLDVPRGELPPLTRTELWTDKVVPRSAVQLPANVSISDGTGNGVVGMCKISDASVYALLSRIHAGDTSVEAELAGLIRSLEDLIARGTSADLGGIYCDCQAALRILQQTRDAAFDPMLKPQGRCAILQLFLSVMYPYTPSSSYRLHYVPAHSDEQDQDLILEEELPLFQGHVQCDKLAPLCQELPGKAGITFFTTDFEFALFNIQGTRLFQPLRAYLTELGFSMEYHARMTRTPRADLLGFPWREVPWEELHLPKQHTPWDGKKALQPAERSSKDCDSMREALRRVPQLKVGVIQGHGKCLNPIRLQVLGGLASVTKSAPRKGELPQPDLCPFCVRKPMDSLDHAVSECLMNKWLSS